MDTILLLLLIASFLIARVNSYSMVTGTVFCDQCKDGQVSLFDYPQQGVKVTIGCRGSDGQVSTWQETTNWLGNYVIKFDATPNLSGCYAQVTPNGQACGAAAGPPKYLRLMFNMFGMEMYTVDPLLAQPAHPMSFCQNSPPPPRFSLPPPSPPVPFSEASACPHQKWILPEYRCYWKVVSPDTKVAVVFGLVAAGKYGTNMNLAHGLLGRGDPYRTLLREGTTALLNSYNSVQFPYNTIQVIQNMNWALLGSTRRVLHTALGFMKANSGIGTNATCRFTTCK